jgi:phosphoenolpyruvate carboxylase
MVNAVLLGSMSRGASRAAGPDAEALLDRVAGASRAAYDSLVRDRERLARYTVAATPIHEISELPIASRPASRKPGLVLEDLRAIPWVFSWTQSRHGVPGWFGLGAALDAAIGEVGLEGVRALYADWPFFRGLIDNAQLALARADIGVAEQYARLAEAESPELRGVFDEIRTEHARTCERVLSVTNERRLLADQPTIAETVERRNPYVDVLSHAQIELLRRLRTASSDAARAQLRASLFVTINGIAAGLMTAG